MNDKDFQDFPDEHIQGLVNGGLKYLSTRIGFWRQQNPLYARRKVDSKVVLPRTGKSLVDPSADAGRAGQGSAHSPANGSATARKTQNSGKQNSTAVRAK